MSFHHTPRNNSSFSKFQIPQGNPNPEFQGERKIISANKIESGSRTISPTPVNFDNRNVRINSVRINNNSGNCQKIDINLALHIDEKGMVSAQVIPNSLTNKFMVFPPQTKILHQEVRYPQPNTNKPWLQMSPRPQQQQFPAQFNGFQNRIPQQVPQFFNSRMQQTKIFCVICEQFYTLDQKQGHKKKHMKTAEYSKKFPNKFGAIIKSRFSQEIVTRPIVQPESYNIRYNPNNYKLARSPPPQAVVTKENGIGTHQEQKNNQIQITPQMIKQPTKINNNQGRQTQIQMGDSIFQEIIIPEDDGKIFITQSQNQRILRDTVNSDKNSYPLLPQPNNNEKQQLNLHKSLQFKNPFNYSRNSQYYKPIEKAERFSLTMSMDQQHLTQHIKQVQSKYQAPDYQNSQQTPFLNKEEQRISENIQDSISSSTEQMNNQKKSNKSEKKFNYVYKKSKKSLSKEQSLRISHKTEKDLLKQLNQNRKVKDSFQKNSSNKKQRVYKQSLGSSQQNYQESQKNKSVASVRLSVTQQKACQPPSFRNSIKQKSYKQGSQPRKSRNSLDQQEKMYYSEPNDEDPFDIPNSGSKQIYNMKKKNNQFQKGQSKEFVNKNEKQSRSSHSKDNGSKKKRISKMIVTGWD